MTGMTLEMINARPIFLAAAALLMRQAAGPLSAQFLPPDPSSTTRELRYSLSDRAYVAVFVILPAHGVAVLYPFNPPSASESAGEHFVPLQAAGIRHEERAAALVSDGDQADKTYLLLVASRTPLRVDQYVTRPETLDSAIGPEVQRSTSTDAVVASIVKLVVHVSSADDVAFDVDQTRAVIPGR